MSFLFPHLLWLLLPLAALLVAILIPTRSAARIAHPRIARALLRGSQLVPGAPGSRPRPLAACAALAALVLALARPQGGTITVPSVVEARDVLVAVDVSRSMLAEDVSPSRLDRARLLVRSLADALRGERLGLLPFAGTAFLQSPLSADYEIFQTFLDELGPDMIPAGGSDFGALLHTAGEAFGLEAQTAGSAPDDEQSPDSDPAAPSTPAAADRFLIVLSDGEAQDDEWRKLAKELAAKGVRMITLGLGSTDGATIPDGEGGLVKDSRGAVVLSRLDSSTLRELARISDGAYRDASAWVDLPALLRETVERGHASRTTADTATQREELFAWFLVPALLLLALSLLREFPFTPRPRNLAPAPARPPARRVAACIALPLALAATLAPTPQTRAAVAQTANAPTPPTPPAPPAGTGTGSAAEPEPPPDPLVELVGKLASAETVAPADLARLAALTAERGEQARASGTPPPPEGALRDALAAVEQGAAEAPSAAEWTQLRQRLETLLAPPPKPPQSDQQKPSENSDSQSDDSQPQDSEHQNSDSSSSSGSQQNQSSQPSDSSQNSSGSESQSGQSGQKDESGANSEAAKGQDPQASSANGDPSSAGQNSSAGSDSAKPGDQSDDRSGATSGQDGKPPASEALGELGRPTDDKAGDEEKPTAVPSPADEASSSEKSDSENPADTPTQRVGGVSASGQNASGTGADADGDFNPTLYVPLQRLERVRDNDAPARLYQLLQEAETPPDSARRAADGAPARDW